jgi:tungstate transport system substrate-binding protein
VNATRSRQAIFGLLTHWCLAIGLVVLPTVVLADDRSIVMASTTSTEQSGLFAHLMPAFKKATGIDVRVVAVGTGQALDMSRRSDADVLFVPQKRSSWPKALASSARK